MTIEYSITKESARGDYFHFQDSYRNKDGDIVRRWRVGRMAGPSALISVHHEDGKPWKTTVESRAVEKAALLNAHRSIGGNS